MYQELLQFVFTVAPNYKGIVNVSKPALWFIWGSGQSTYFEGFHKIVCYYRTEMWTKRQEEIPLDHGL